MERIGNKVSYIKKPFAKSSFPSALLAAAALCFMTISLWLAYKTQGNASLFAAALGFCSIVTAAASLIYGILALLEKEKNYRIAKVSTAIAGIEILIWLIIIVIAL